MERNLRRKCSVSLESLSTRTFLLYGGLFSVSRLDREERFWREFLLKQRAYHNDGRTQGKKAQKLTLKSSVVKKV